MEQQMGQHLEERKSDMRHKKLVAVLSIILLGLTSLNISMAEPADLNDKALKIEMQDENATETVDRQQVDNNLVSEENGVAADKTIAAQPISQPIPDRNNQAPAVSRKSAHVSSHNLDSLAKVVFGEARGEPFVGQVAIAAVVLNRVESDKFGSTVNEVIFEPGAFTAVSDGQYYLQPNNEAYQAAQAAIDGWDPTNDAIYYWNPATATNKWIWSRPITITIGKHVFAH
jgi:N-acetylmuramoyl-L-alanine amidase